MLTPRFTEEERRTIPLLMILVFSREKAGCCPELDMDGFCQAMDIALGIIESKEPGICEHLKLVPHYRKTYARAVLGHYQNLVSLGAWRGQTIIRFKPNAGQNLRNIMSTFRVDIAWKSEVERACEEARMLYRKTIDPPED